MATRLVARPRPRVRPLWLRRAVAAFVVALVVGLPLRAALPIALRDSDTPASAPIQPRRALAAAMLDGRVYASGGWSGEVTQLATVEVRDPNSGRWRASPPMAVARSQHGMIAADGKLWVVGGWSATAGLVPTVETWRPDAPAWTTVTHLPTPRREPAVAVLGRWIVVAGGFNGINDGDMEGYSDRVEAYDLDSGQWRTLAPLPTPRRGLTMVAFGNMLYALDGFAGDGGYLNRVERYDPRADRWTTLDWSITPRTWAASVVADGAILVIGGYNRGGALGLVERIDPATGVVCTPPSLRLPRAWLAAVPVPGGVLTLGGEEVTRIGGTVEIAKVECATTR